MNCGIHRRCGQELGRNRKVVTGALLQCWRYSQEFGFKREEGVVRVLSDLTSFPLFRCCLGGVIPVNSY